MKYLRFILLLGLLAPISLTTACHTSPNQRVNEVKTLKIVGASVDTTMKLAAKLYVDGKISQAQWATIADIHDHKFQPVFKAAVTAVQANLDSVADPALIQIAADLSALLNSYSQP